MTDNEIIKANEICNGIQDKHCEECPYQNIRDNDCVVVLAKDTIDLINRQKASIKGLNDLVGLAIDTQNEFSNKIHEQEAEIEKLCIEIDDLIIAKDLLFDEAEALIKKAKAEAIKEFAERLKDKVDDPVLIEGKYIDRAIDIIDKLVKEMFINETKGV